MIGDPILALAQGELRRPGTDLVDAPDIGGALAWKPGLKATIGLLRCGQTQSVETKSGSVGADQSMTDRARERRVGIRRDEHAADYIVRKPGPSFTQTTRGLPQCPSGPIACAHLTAHGQRFEKRRRDQPVTRAGTRSQGSCLLCHRLPSYERASANARACRRAAAHRDGTTRPAYRQNERKMEATLAAGPTESDRARIRGYWGTGLGAAERSR